MKPFETFRRRARSTPRRRRRGRLVSRARRRMRAVIRDRIARALAARRCGDAWTTTRGEWARAIRSRDISTDDAATTTTTTTTSTLRARMRALVRLVHPDVLASTHPALSRANEEALAHLQGTLDGVRRSTTPPSARVKRLVFHVRDDDVDEGGTRAVRFTLRTTGGDCRNVMKRDLGGLFAALGIEREFEWDEEDWRSTRTDEEVEEERRRRSEHAETSRSSGEEEVAQAYREQPAGKARGAETRDVHSALKDLDPALEAIAAVAWLPDAEKDVEEGERKRIVQYEVIPHLVREGWNLKGETLEAIWRGERDEKILLDGIDGGSALAVLAILKHTKNLERMYGPAPTQR